MLMQDTVYISRNAIKKIISIVITDNKDLFIQKTYLKVRNTKNIRVHFNDDKSVSIDLKMDLINLKNINEAINKLQENIVFMVEYSTGLKVKDINIKVEDYR